LTLVISLKKIILLTIKFILSNFKIIRIRDDLKRPLILDYGVIGLTRVGEIISYTRGLEANRINVH
jgi:hypothetical protein